MWNICMEKFVAYFKFLSHQLPGRSQDKQEEIRYLCIRRHLVTKVQEGDTGQYSATFCNLYVLPLFLTEEKNFDFDSVG
jgi:hypothetical protein